LNESLTRALGQNLADDTVPGVEAELLLCCAQHSMDSGKIDRAQKLLCGSELEWKRLFAKTLSTLEAGREWRL
jgi:hypothetical protein